MAAFIYIFKSNINFSKLKFAFLNIKKPVNQTNRFCIIVKRLINCRHVNF